MNKKIITLSLAFILVFSSLGFADVAVGDSIVSIGADLTKEQREKMLDEFKYSENENIIEVTNNEEHEYLGGIIPKAQIGSKALSSAKITYTKEGSGLNVNVSDKINYIKPEIYKNALITAGVSDVDIYVSAPISVSGTAALTGILKAYEVSTGKTLSKEFKKTVNEELVLTSEIGEDVGNEKAAEIINNIKIQISEKAPKNKDEIRNIINNTTNNYNIKLTDNQVEELTNLFDKMKDLNIDWDKVAKEAEKIKDKATEYFSSEEGQSFLQSLKSGFSKFIDWFASLFRKK